MSAVVDFRRRLTHFLSVDMTSSSMASLAVAGSLAMLLALSFSAATIIRSRNRAQMSS
jgi:hypothetical protein